jgi:putative ABC transport system permease protein
MPAGSYTGAFSKVLLEIPGDEAYSVVSLEEKIAGFDAALAPTTVLAAVAFLIGVLVISVVTSLLVEESRQTISLLKLLGYRRGESNALVLNSSTVVVVAGYLLGIPLVLGGLGVLLQSTV